MIRSLRWRIQLWHSLVLILAVSAFGTFFGLWLRQSSFDQIDTELLGAGQALRAAMGALPKHVLLDGVPPRDGRRPPPHDERAIQMDRMIQNLRLPVGLLERHDPPPYFIAWRANGEVIRKSSSAPAIAWTDRPRFRDETSPVFARRRHFRDLFLPGPDGTALLVGRSIRREIHDLEHAVWIIVAVGAATVLVGIVGGFLLSQRALRPLAKMNAAAAEISADNLSQRLDTTKTDIELTRLATTLNAALDRLEASFLRQARFTADASHELRTPLTIILGHLELAIAAAQRQEEHTESLAAAQRAARRMKSLVEDLLLLARSDNTAIDQQTIDFAASVEECLDLLAPLAAQKQVTITSTIKPVELPGDPRLLAQVVINLVTNAIVHNRAGGTVQVTLRREGDQALLVVTDDGPGIPQEAQPHLFERFFRADAARSRETGGSGLGLAIASTIVQAHRGAITFTSAPRSGATFTVVLPAHASDEA